MIEEQIGRGGMGAVYIATDNKFGSRVAIKERSYEDAELARAFEREARLLNSLHHPILPHVSDYFSEGGRYFLVMEYIEGEDLSAVLVRGGAFPVEPVIRWTLELLDGLDYLHLQDPPVIHRDIKPGNLKLTPRGNIVLLDFGLAKESENNTLAGQSVFGYSRRYSPLEQIEGTGTDARSDIFSLGATVFHLITGEPPTDALARASAIVAGRPDPLRPATEINEQVPEKVAAVINSALALNAEGRFVSAAAMRAALEYAISDEGPVNTEAAAGSASPFAAPGVFQFHEPPRVDEQGRGAERPASDSADPHFAAAPGEMHLPAAAIPAVPQNRVRVRFIRPFWQRPAVRTAAVLACLLVFSYVIYRSVSPGGRTDAPPEQPVATRAAMEQPIDVAESNTPSLPALPPVEPAADELAGAAESMENQTKNRPRSDKPKQAAIEPEQTDEPNGPFVREKGPESRPRIVSVQQTPQRPVRPAFPARPPIYSIETIISGVPPADQEREGRRQRRQLSMWEQEQLRRQRFEDMIRSTRRWQPPF